MSVIQRLPEQADRRSEVPASAPLRVSGAVLTAGQLRTVLAAVPDNAPIRVGIRDRHHFNAFLGMLPVRGLSVHSSAGEGTVVIVEVPGVS